jgi:hypothetical protein
MAQKFGNGRWVREGFLDNRVPGFVIGRIFLAGVGWVDLCLRGDFKGDIAGRAIRLRNSRYEDDAMAEQVLADFEVPQVGTVSLISFDPHPLLQPHPYIEWFSDRKNHYRIELEAGDAWVVTPDEAAGLDGESRRIRKSLGGSRPAGGAEDESDWV